MKINIVQKLDTHMLNMTIEGLRTNSDYKIESTYLIMSDETFRSLGSDGSLSRVYGSLSKVYEPFSNPTLIPQYHGIKIAICNALDFGEIDVVRG